MKDVIDFLDQLNQNNNREWFNQNKNQYIAVNKQCNEFAEKLIERLAQSDSTLKGITVSDCTYRIYRDTRFAADKTPYKNHIGIYICRGGKNSGYAGYYIHFQAQDHAVLAAGLHCPEPKIIKSVREDIDLNGARFVDAMSHASAFTLESQNSLKRTPKGYAEDNPLAQYLKLKDFVLTAPLSYDTVVSDSLLDYATTELLTCKPFNDVLNQAVDYAHEMF